MLIRFAVENYNSFKDQQIFSMVAGKQTRHATHYFAVNGKRLLKSSFFFGANASGKSNFVRALDFMRRMTLLGMEAMRYNDRFFRIDPASKEKPGVFQIDFIAQKTIFSYGFAIDYLAHEFCAEWLKNIIVVYPGSHARDKNNFFLNQESNMDSMIDMLRDFDTGIEEIKKGKQLAEKAFSFLPDEVKKNILDDLEQTMRNKSSDKTHFTIVISDYQFEISVEDGDLYAEKIMLDHGNSEELFELSDESDGTKRLFDLIPLYESGQKGKIIVVDELDRSFHSKLTEEYIKRFFEITEGKSCQLICTTHDLNLMDLKILRQDEIWFIEREKDHSS